MISSFAFTFFRKCHCGSDLRISDLPAVGEQIFWPSGSGVVSNQCVSSQYQSQLTLDH
jgi:hypothetical protein